MKTTSKHVIVAGGGVAGMEAAGALAELGHTVSLVEKEQNPGGHLLQWHALFHSVWPDQQV